MQSYQQISFYRNLNDFENVKESYSRRQYETKIIS